MTNESLSSSGTMIKINQRVVKRKNLLLSNEKIPYKERTIIKKEPKNISSYSPQDVYTSEEDDSPTISYDTYNSPNIYDEPEPLTVTVDSKGSIYAENAEDNEDISCICHQVVYDGRFMLDCDNCHKWFHGECVGINQFAPPEDWNCTNCIRNRELARQKILTESKERKDKKMAETLEALKNQMTELTSELHSLQKAKQDAVIQAENDRAYAREQEEIYRREAAYVKPEPAYTKPKPYNPSAHKTGPMPMKEKSAIFERINALPGEDLQKVVEIIQRLKPAALSVVDEEMELNLESLDKKTLIEIRGFIDERDKTLVV